MKWIDNMYNLIFLGLHGVGKSHLMIGLGYRAAELGYHVFFLTMSELIYFLKNKDSCRKSKEVINRLVYRCQVFNLKGNSYRLENRETIFK